MSPWICSPSSGAREPPTLRKGSSGLLRGPSEPTGPIRAGSGRATDRGREPSQAGSPAEGGEGQAVQPKEHGKEFRGAGVSGDFRRGPCRTARRWERGPGGERGTKGGGEPRGCQLPTLTRTSTNPLPPHTAPNQNPTTGVLEGPRELPGTPASRLHLPEGLLPLPPRGGRSGSPLGTVVGPWRSGFGGSSGWLVQGRVGQEASTGSMG